MCEILGKNGSSECSWKISLIQYYGCGISNEEVISRSLKIDHRKRAMYFFSDFLMILVPDPVANAIVFPDARNITVSWMTPKYIFGVLKYYSVICYFNSVYNTVMFCKMLT